MLPSFSIWSGGLLTLLGIVGYVGTEAKSLTALIPTVFGLLLVGLGLAARSGRHGWAAPALAGVAVLGLAGTLPAIGALATLLGGGDVERPIAVVGQGILLVVSAALLGLSLRGVLDARRQPGRPA